MIDIESNTRIKLIAPNLFEISWDQEYLCLEKEIRILDEVNHFVLILELQFDKRANYQRLILCV
jgi:hypothetical protein